MTIIQDIESIVGKKGLITGKDVFNRKAGIWIDDGIRADAIVRPKDTLELSKVLAICNKNKQAVIPHGGLTGLAEGAITQQGQIAISSERLTAIEEVDEIGRTMTLQAGVPLEKAQEEAEKYNLMLPVDLGARGSCTVGGNISTNAGGNMVIKYGMMRDNVLEIEGILSDGSTYKFGNIKDKEIASSKELAPQIINNLLNLALENKDEILTKFPKVLRRVGGYNIDSLLPDAMASRPNGKKGDGINLSHLLVGSEGTLVYSSAITLKLSPLPSLTASQLFLLQHFQLSPPLL